MEIKCLKPSDSSWNKTIKYVENCGWSAGKSLAAKMRDGSFNDWERVFVIEENEKIQGYCTFVREDCLKGLSYMPYIGYVFISDECRGMRYSEKLIKHVLNYARENGFKKVYVVSTHVNFYEKYGFYKVDEKPGHKNPEIMESIFAIDI